MLTNGSVTVYHYNEASGGYTPKQYKNVSVYFKCGSECGGSGYRGSGGFRDSNVCKIRIPTSKEIDISCDDYIYLGLSGGKIDKSKCRKVFAFADNRRGSLKHWRIDCK